jgi:ribonuclease HI|tara:strand:- start:3747 stop:4172 length:426 start_codon:yes stop_codon:yes gene_type:complete
MKYKIYTDGACSGNPGKGGWAAIILNEKSIQSNVSGGENRTTNNRMELMAPIMALNKIKKSSEIIIYTDSKYVKDGITEWIKKWKLNNWKSANKKPVKNKDLWIKLDNSCQKHKVTWKWVKAHAGNKFNNLVDELAVLETK